VNSFAAGKPATTSTCDVLPGTAAAASTGEPANTAAAAGYAATAVPEHGDDDDADDDTGSDSSCIDGVDVPTKCTATPSLISATTRTSADGCVVNSHTRVTAALLRSIVTNECGRDGDDALVDAYSVSAQSKNIAASNRSRRRVPSRSVQVGAAERVATSAKQHGSTTPTLTVHDDG
jgi:hypothetical protein